MPIDSSIISRLVPAQIQQVDPMERYGKSLALQNLMRQGDAQDRAAQEYDRKVKRQSTLEALLAQGGDDVGQRLLKGGFLDEALKVEKERRERDKITADTGNTNAQTIERTLANYKTALPQLGGPQDAAQWLTAQYNDPVLGPIMNRMAPLEMALSRIPQDAKGFQDWQFKASAGIDKFMADQRAREQQAETGRHNLATEGNAAGQLAVSQGQLGVARGNLGVSQDRLAFDRTKPIYDPERGVFVSPPAAGVPVAGASAAGPAAGGGASASAPTSTPAVVTPTGLPPKMSEAQKKELSNIDAQANTVRGALDAVTKTPTAFSGMRGMATMAGALPETVAGRFDTSDQRQARSFVFNVVSKVINERAGAAQSAQELARLRSFLPAEADNADQIKDKLTAFQSYLDEQRSAWQKPQGAPAPKPEAPKPAPPKPQIGERQGDYIFNGGDPADPKSWKKI